MRPAMRRPLPLLPLGAALALLLSPAADAGKKKDKDKGGIAVTPTSMSVAPPSNVFLRNAFDTDPSRYLGRFVPDGMTALDESSSIKTQCSTFISWTKVGGGGVIHDELYQVSDSAAASFGFPPFISVGGSGESSKMVRVKYTATGKMVSDIEDPAAFEACCKQAPDQCTERYIGEFTEGSAGQIYYAVGTQADFGASGMGQGMAGEVEVKHGMAWQRGIEFPNPVYFGFKTSLTGFKVDGAPSGCGDWVNSPPKTTQGKYFVGVSEFLDSERLSRDVAMTDARTQTVKWVGESITTGSTEVRGYAGDVGNLGTQLDNEQFLETAATGVAALVKDENWCLEESATPRGVLVKAKVLAFLPKESYTQAAEALQEAAAAAPAAPEKPAGP